MAQTELLPQRNFPMVPAGNYSGITPLGGGRYAVVSDKSATDGFFVFHIDIDSVSGQIRDVRNEGFRPTTLSNRDEEGIAFRSADSTVYISGETDNAILQYRLDGTPTGRRFILPADLLAVCRGNLSLESLSYNAATHRFWACNEGAPWWLAFRWRHAARATYHYVMDAPVHDASRAQYYAHGVSELLALDDGTLLYSNVNSTCPTKNRGFRHLPNLSGEPNWYNCRRSETNIHYSISDRPIICGGETNFRCPIFHPFIQDSCLEWETSLFSLAVLANYEGMCLGPLSCRWATGCHPCSRLSEPVCRCAQRLVPRIAHAAVNSIHLIIIVAHGNLLNQCCLMEKLIHVAS